jgi:hypothetical protein
MSNKIMVTTALPKEVIEKLDKLKKVYNIKKGKVIELGIDYIYRKLQKEDVINQPRK